MGVNRWQKAVTALCASSLLLMAGGTAGASAARQAPHKVINGGTATVGLFEEPDTLNPIEGPLMFFAQDVMQALYANLFQIQPNGSLSPLLATTVPSTSNGGISQNGLVYTIHLKHGAKWSNGDPFTARDIWITWKLETNPQVTVASNQGWTDVKNVQILDPYDFKITLFKPYQPLLAVDFTQTMPGIVPYTVFSRMAPAAVNKAAFNHDPTVTNGPFEFQSWVPGASITLVRNPNWVGPKPHLDKIVFKIIPDANTLLTNTQSGGLNVYAGDAVQQVPQLKTIPGAQLHYGNSSLFESLFVNFRNPILRDVRVRQALEMGIDRPQMVTDVIRGTGTLLAADQSVASWGNDPKIQPWPFDIKKAAQLLNEAGWKMSSNGYRYKNGKELELTYITTAGNPARQENQQLSQYTLKQIGVKISIKDVPAVALFGSILPSGQGWDLAEVAYNDQGANPASPEANYETGGAENFGQFSYAPLDALYKKQDVLTTQAQRKPILMQIEQIMHTQLPSLWLYSPQTISTTVNMNGYVLNPWMQDTWNCYAWALTKN